MSPPPAKKEKSAPTPAKISVTQFILASILFQFCLSYIITETWTWGYKNKWTQPRNWKYIFVPPQKSRGLIQSSPLNLTEAELAKFDGSDPNLPLYLAIE